MIVAALGYMALIWVLNSWAKMFIKPENKLYRFMCLQCWTLWITLALTLDPFTASIAALMAAVVDSYLNNIEVKL